MGSKPTKEEPAPAPAAETVVKPALNPAILKLTMKTIDRAKRIGQIKKAAKEDMSKLPPVQPSKVRKKDIFAARQMQTAYKRANSVSRDECENYDKLIEHLTGKSSDEVEAVWTIFLWLINLDLTKPEWNNAGSGDNPLGAIRDVISGKSDLQLFFRILCKKMNQPCMIAEGFTKKDKFKLGCLQSEAKSSQDHWNYVYIKGEWRFVHPELAASGPRKNKSFFFLTDPSDFINFCFPTEIRWQLSDDPVLWKDFAKKPLCRPNFFAMGLVLVKPNSADLTITNETVNIEISAPVELMDKILLHYRFTGKQVKQFVEKEDTISNDSLPDSPYQSQVDLKEDFSDPAFVLQTMFGKDVFKKPVPGGGLAGLKLKLADKTNGASTESTEKPAPGGGLNGLKLKLADKNNGANTESTGKPVLMNGGPPSGTEDTKPAPVLASQQKLASVMAPVKKSNVDGISEEKVQSSKVAKSSPSVQNSKVDLKLKKQKFDFSVPYDEKPSKLVFGSSIVSSRPVRHPNVYTAKNPNKLSKKMIDEAFKSADLPLDAKTVDSEVNKVVNPSAFPSHLERYVYLHYGYSRFIFEIELPVTGIYTFEILGDFINFNDVSPDITTLPSICTFNIEKVGQALNVPQLPVVTEVGWGPNPYVSVYGLKPQSHTEGRVYVESTEEITMQFEIFGTLDLHKIKIETKLRNPSFKPQDLEGKSRHIIVGDTLFIRVAVPGKGQFALKVFAKKKGEQGFKNICNYLIIYGKPEVKNPFGDITDDKYSKRMIRERLQKAILYGNEAELRKALDNFELHIIPDEGEVAIAKKRLDFFRLQKDLHIVVQRRHAQAIKEVLEKAKASEYAPELRNEITEADNILSSLNRLDGYTHKVRKPDRDTLAEMRAYMRPKPIVLDVMKATCMLLGEEKDNLTTWESIQPHLWKKGNDSLLNRMENLRVGSIDPSVIKDVKEILGKYPYKEIRESSNNVATFQKWIDDVCAKRQAIIEKERKRLQDRLKKSVTDQIQENNIAKTLDVFKAAAAAK